LALGTGLALLAIGWTPGALLYELAGSAGY